MAKIVNLENKETKKLYSNVQEKVDAVTGEVTTVISSFLQREKTKDDFIKLFVENISFLTDNLSNPALRVVLMMIKNLNYQNVFNYSSDFVRYFESRKILGKSSVYRAIKELEEKQVIFKVTEEQRKEYDIIGSDSYIMNPQIIGKGSFKDLKKLRQTVIKTFDFDNLEFKQEVSVESEYEGLEQIKKNPDHYVIEEVKQIASDKNVVENQVIISKKDDEQINYPPLKQEKIIDINNSVPSLTSNDNKEPTLFNGTKNEQKAMAFINEFAGIFNGAFDPNKTAKEMKKEFLENDLKKGNI
ncbi:replication/maintenance protein RepL [Campylobacter lari]|uniref:Plasmid replication protein RepL domain-containing protein n=1 Tax=Campylobacter lari TaxID=201 RepID=A0A825SII7_CAMLA|nr:replication/maintenance protein RepL [Campylobacter lari]EAK0451880.1 hypothetical protein [Campylobacter lari]MPB17317.1 hypothetical protein [Campylobacter lari]